MRGGLEAEWLRGEERRREDKSGVEEERERREERRGVLRGVCEGFAKG